MQSTDKILQEFDKRFKPKGEEGDEILAYSIDAQEAMAFLLRAVEEAEQAGRDMAVGYISRAVDTHPGGQTLSYSKESWNRILEKARSSRPNS